jgi:hypothetical protein
VPGRAGSWGGGYQQVGMVFPQQISLLSDPNILIGDTAAIVHTSPYKHEMVPQMKTKNLKSVTYINGHIKQTAMY